MNIIYSNILIKIEPSVNLNYNKCSNKFITLSTILFEKKKIYILYLM